MQSDHSGIKPEVSKRKEIPKYLENKKQTSKHESKRKEIKKNILSGMKMKYQNLCSAAKALFQG